MSLSDLWVNFRSFVQFGQNGEFPGICSVKQFRAILESERYRADRNQHVFSLLVFDIGRSDENQIQIRCLAHVLKKRIRLTDRAGWLDNRRVGVVLPYTSAAGACQLAGYICQEMVSKFAPPEYTVYTYPSIYNSESNGHSDQLNFADLSPLWNTKMPKSFSISAKNADSPNTNFASRQSRTDMIRNCHKAAPSLELLFAQRLPLWKRSMDILGALIGLIVLSPLLLLLCLIIKIVSPGPIIFKQERIKCLGRIFSMWKFRTMDVETDISIHKQHVATLIKSVKSGNPNLKNPMVKLDSHPHIIPLGKCIRKMCLDEIPQLINVLRGEMSLVGPRPPLSYEVEEYPQWYYGRFNTVPGMTGLWQVSGKNRLNFDEMVRLDIQYSRNASLWLDIKIILKTPSVIISQIKESLQKKWQKGGVVKYA